MRFNPPTRPSPITTTLMPGTRFLSRINSFGHFLSHWKASLHPRTAFTHSDFTADVRSLVVLALTMFGAAFVATAQVTYGSANHNVTVQVSAITVMQVSSGTVNLNITAANATAGQDQMSVVNQSTSLLWGTNSSARKITVRSSLAAPKFTLNLLAQSPTAGTAAPEVTLNSTSRDFLLNIGRTLGSCILRYTGVALASQGTGSDTHTITFTIQGQ